MRHRHESWLSLVLLLGLTGCGPSEAPQAPVGASEPATAPAQAVASPVTVSAEALAEAGENYQQFCAICHGTALEGTRLASSLTDGVWKYGGTDEDLALSIRNGHPEDGMQPWGPVFSEEQIQALVQLIRKPSGS